MSDIKLRLELVKREKPPLHYYEVHRVYPLCEDWLGDAYLNDNKEYSFNLYDLAGDFGNLSVEGLREASEVIEAIAAEIEKLNEGIK